MKRSNRILIVFALSLVFFQVAGSGAEKIYRYCTPNQDETRFRVANVLDGDTIQVVSDGHLVTVHLLGIDAPEVVATGKQDGYCGFEARHYITKLLEGYNTFVGLDTDQNQLAGEVWAYVYLFVRDRDRVSRDIFLNGELVRAGMARVIETETVYVKHKEKMLALQKEAKDLKRGIWGTDTCNSYPTEAIIYDRSGRYYQNAPENTNLGYRYNNPNYYYYSGQYVYPYNNYNDVRHSTAAYPYYYNYPQYYNNYEAGYYHTYGCRAVDPTSSYVCH